MTFVGFRTGCAVQHCGLVWWVSLLSPRLSWALHHGGSPVTSHGLLKWAATSHIKSTPWKALVLLQILLATLPHRTVFISIFHVFCPGWLRVKPCWMAEALGKGAWLRGRYICRSWESGLLWIMAVDRAAFGSQWAIWKCLKTTHSSRRGRAETSTLPSVYYTPIYLYIGVSAGQCCCCLRLWELGML